MHNYDETKKYNEYVMRGDESDSIYSILFAIIAVLMVFLVPILKDWIVKIIFVNYLMVIFN